VAVAISTDNQLELEGDEFVLFDWELINVLSVDQLDCFIYVENGRGKRTKLGLELAFIPLEVIAFAA
jgi:hypothetical protein